MHVLKFGGTSVGTPQNIRRVAEIVKQIERSGHKQIVVVSAFAGITDLLQQITQVAPARDTACQLILDKIEKRHQDAINALIPDAAAEAWNEITPFLIQLKEAVRGAYLLRECSPRIHDLILSFGERLSATVIAVYFKHNGMAACFRDTTEFLISDDRFGGARVDMARSMAGIKTAFSGEASIFVTTGFIASTGDGRVTTFGRGGSDYSAAVLAAAVDAPEVKIWTDVNGVMSANPAIVKRARSLSAMTYQEAMELSHFGAGVLYPPTIQPAMEKNIPIRILNTFNPDFEGTVINRSGSGSSNNATGITAIPDIALLTIEGSGMIGVPGIAARLFGFLAAADVNVILITQASSEHSICVALHPADVSVARKAIENGFRHEIRAREMERVRVQKGLCVLAVVGQNMRHVPGIAARLFQALGQKGINVYAIAQGSSELNVSVVLNKKHINQALNAVHEAFIHASAKTPVFLLGVGGVGSALLAQIDALGTDAPIVVCGIANSRRMWIEHKGIDLTDWQRALDKKGKKMNSAVFLSAMPAGAVLVDCTANAVVTDLYEKALAAGISVATANKIAFAQSGDRYQVLHRLAVESGASLGYEATVGAGLPVIATLKMLRRCGDVVDRVEAVLSGSLGYIFSTLTPGKKFSAIVRRAGDLGYTEPDPRVDLGGADVARKILIIARECGVSAEWSDIERDDFLPQSCRDAADLDAFFIALEQADGYFEGLAQKSAARGRKLCYAAEFNPEYIRAGLKEVEPGHPFYDLSPGENMLIIHSRNYTDTPMVIRGMGAGTAVTASAVLNDILQSKGVVNRL